MTDLALSFVLGAAVMSIIDAVIILHIRKSCRRTMRDMLAKSNDILEEAKDLARGENNAD